MKINSRFILAIGLGMVVLTAKAESADSAGDEPALSALTLSGAGKATQVGGTFNGWEGVAAASLTLEVSQDGSFSSSVVSYDLGSFSPGAAFSRSVTVVPGALTYFRVTATAAGKTESVVGSCKSRTSSTLSSINSSAIGFCGLKVTGKIKECGAGTTTVKVRWGRDKDNLGAPQVVGTVEKDGDAFSVEHTFGLPEGKVYYQIIVENEFEGDRWTTSGDVKSAEVLNLSTYYWQAVDGEWNGDISDARHWATDSDLPAGESSSPLGWPKATVSFANCPSDGTEVVITVDQDFKVGKVESKTAGQRLTFTGEPGTKVEAFFGLLQASATNTFDKIVWEDSNTNTDVMLDDNAAYVLTGGAQLTVRLFYSYNGETASLSVGEDCVATIKSMGQERGKRQFIVDNGTLIHQGFVGQNHGGATVDYLIKGKKGRVVFTSKDSYLNNSWKRVKFTFEIPEGGYDQVPVTLQTQSDGPFLRFSNESVMLTSSFCKGGEGTGLIFEVLPSSPLLYHSVHKVLEQDLFCWCKAGWASDRTVADAKSPYDLHDYTYLFAPTARSDGHKVKRFSLAIRGIDEEPYPNPQALRAAGTEAYAVSYKMLPSPGVTLLVR